MTYSAPSTASHSFRPYQPTSAPAPSRPLFTAYPSYEYDAPQQQPAASYRRRSEDSTPYHGKHLSAPTSSAHSAASFSPLSLCSSVSSCSSSSSAASSAYSSPADTFDLEEDAMDDDHHAAYYQHPQPRHHKPTNQQLHPMAPKPSRAHSAQDGMYYAPQPASVAAPPHMYGHASHSPPPPAMTVSIPAANGGWKDPSVAVVRRRDLAPPVHPVMPVEPPQYMPAPLQAVVASSVGDLADGKASGGKKKKGRSLRRCMDREKHSKAEQKRRGEMKVLFDQLQDISQCVYKDRIHILTLAIQTITRQQDQINELQAQVKSSRAKVKAVKKELAAADSTAATTASSPSGPSTPSSPAGGSVGSKRAAVAAELDCEPAPVKQEEESAASPHSPKKQRTSPQPREVVDLSAEAAFAALPPVSHHDLHTSSTVSAHATSYVSKPLHSSFSSSSLSTFVCGSGDAHHGYPYLMDDHHGAYPASQHAEEAVAANKSQLASHVMHATQPCESPVFSFSAHPQHWWPTQTAEQTKH